MQGINREEREKRKSAWIRHIIASIYFSYHAYYFSEISKCSSEYNISIFSTTVAMTLNTIIVLVIRYFVGSNCLRPSQRFINILIVLLIIRSGLYINSSVIHCHNPSTLINVLIRIDMTLIFFTGMMLLLILSIFVWIIYRECKMKKERENANRELEKLYEDILREDFDLEMFISKYKDVLDMYTMGKKDLVVLKDYFGHVNQLDESEVEESERRTCAICIGELSIGEVLVVHPGCKHLFHWDCLGPWMTRPNFQCGCPLCKRPTMVSMLRDIRAKVTKKDVHKSETMDDIDNSLNLYIPADNIL